MVGELEALRERLDRLERSHRRWKLALLSVVVTATSLVGGMLAPVRGQVTTNQRTLTAQRFILLSPRGGGVGAALQFSSRGPELVLLAPGERPRMRFFLEERGPGLHLLDREGGVRAALAFFENEPSLVLYDRNLRVRGVFSVANDRPAMVLLDEGKRPVFQAP